MNDAVVTVTAAAVVARIVTAEAVTVETMTATEEDGEDATGMTEEAETATKAGARFQFSLFRQLFVLVPFFRSVLFLHLITFITIVYCKGCVYIRYESSSA